MDETKKLIELAQQGDSEAMERLVVEQRPDLEYCQKVPGPWI